jgi:BMFP domain-containing protein YqiC
MFNSQHLEELAKKLYSSLPSSLQQVEGEIQQSFKDILQMAFARMDLVTREEFDVQRKVLARTREKVDELEKQVRVLLETNKD